MSKPPTTFAQIRAIDNRKRSISIKASLLVLFLIVLAYWFFTGGSFRLYASLFFFLYSFTHQIWISVILIGITQNLAFLPLRFIGLLMEDRVKQFREAVESSKDSDQYLVFKRKVREGDTSATFFIAEFVVNAIAFLSAGRIFLIDFYRQKLDPKFLYDFVPYPDYPLKGTIFKPPFIRIDQTFALDWSTIFKFWFIVLIIFVVPRLLWRLIRFIFTKNKKLLGARIGYNKALAYVGGFSGTVFLLSLYILRHIPNKITPITVDFDLTKPNRTLNTITAVATFLTTIHAGIKRNNLAVKAAQAANIPDSVIKKVSAANLKNSFNNALILGTGAYFLTNQIPSAFELSVATFEAIYIISPYTFDQILKSAKPKTSSDSPKSN